MTEWHEHKEAGEIPEDFTPLQRAMVEAAKRVTRDILDYGDLVDKQEMMAVIVPLAVQLTAMTESLFGDDVMEGELAAMAITFGAEMMLRYLNDAGLLKEEVFPNNNKETDE